MRFVIDTNIIVSSYLGGTLEAVLKSFKEGQFTLIVTDAIASEYFTVLQRPKFKIKRDEFDDFVALLMSKAEFFSPTETITAVEAAPATTNLSGDFDFNCQRVFRWVARYIKIHFRGLAA